MNKKTKGKGIKFTQKQIDIIIDGFYQSVQKKILDLIFDSEKKSKVVDEMIDFVAQNAVNEIKFPITDEALAKKIEEIMGKNANNMAQDLIFKQVESMLDKSKCDKCATKPSKTDNKKQNEYNKMRGLG
ncbi:MAG: hypothetical protein WC523_04050 [Patescibacteria group bacterium]